MAKLLCTCERAHAPSDGQETRCTVLATNRRMNSLSEASKAVAGPAVDCNMHLVLPTPLARAHAKLNPGSRSATCPGQACRYQLSRGAPRQHPTHPKCTCFCRHMQVTREETEDAHSIPVACLCNSRFYIPAATFTSTMISIGQPSDISYDGYCCSPCSPQTIIILLCHDCTLAPPRHHPQAPQCFPSVA